MAEPGVDQRSPGFAAWAQKVYGWLDAVPVRVSAAGFAVVGNFEDAVYCWRAAVSLPGGALQRRVLQMVGGGALGVRLADPEVQAQLERQAAVLEGESGSGDLDGPGTFDWQGAQPDGPALRSAQGLLWRAVVWWIGVFLVLSAASGLGH